MMSKSIFLICGLFLGLATCQADIAMDTSKPMDVLHGEYTLVQRTTDNYRPTWAAVWKTDAVEKTRKEFVVSMWPITYCHAVYLCPVPAVDYTQNAFKTVDGICEDTYIKYYPHAKKMLIKASKTGTEETVYWMNNKIRFSLNTPDKLTFAVLESSPAGYADYDALLKQEKTRAIDFKLDDNDLLILTNSRMCQAQKVGKDFHPFFQKTIDTDNFFPNWLHDTEKLVHTDALYPAIEVSAETTDLLSPLKEKKWKAMSNVGGFVKRCDSSEGNGGLDDAGNVPFMKESVLSYDIINDQTTASPSAIEFGVQVKECHWFRIWFAKTSETMAAYNVSKNSEYVTVFLNEGFFVKPTSDKAFPLPDAGDMMVFRFRAFSNTPPRTPDHPNLIEMAMGSHRDFLFREYFTPSNNIVNGFTLHIIMAPACDLKLWEPPGFAKYHNHFRPKKCTFSFFKD